MKKDSVMNTEFMKISEDIEDHLEAKLKGLPKEDQKYALHKLIVLVEVYRDDLAKRLKEEKSQLGLSKKGLLERGKQHLGRKSTK